MNLYNVLLNNKIPFTLLETADSENVIYCKSFSDYLFNVGTFATKTKEVILEYTTEQEKKYVIADIWFEDGSCLKQVKFKVIINENAETPHSTINLQNPYNSFDTIDDQPESLIAESFKQQDKERFTAALIKEQELEELDRKVQQEKIALENQKIILEKQNIIGKKLTEYKQELLEEYVNAVHKQKELLQGKIKENLVLAEQELTERITHTFQDYDIQLEDHKNKSRKEQIEFIVSKIDESIVSVQQDLNALVTNKFELEQEQLLDALQVKSTALSEKYEQKLLLQLEQYKESLFEEFRTLSENTVEKIVSEKKDLTEQQIIDTFVNREKQFTKEFDHQIQQTTLAIEKIVQQFSDKLPGIQDNIVLLEDRVKKLLEERTKSEESGKFNVTQQKYIADTAQYWARRILDLGGGGGSVAVQYAKGGTMDGNLSVNNLYPNNGVGEIGTPSNRWDRIYANTIDSLSSNIVIELSGFYVDGDFTVNGTISAVGGNSNQWNSVYSTLNSNSGRYESTYTSLNSNSGRYESNYTTTNLNSAFWSTAYTNLVSNSANYLSGVDISLLASTSGSWNSVYTTTNTNSALWSNWSTVSANYALGSQYVKLSGDTMTGGLSAPALSANVVFLVTGTSLRAVSGILAGPNLFIGDSTTGNNNATGNGNFVFGLSAGNRLTTGTVNNFLGNCAGSSNTTGFANNFFGCGAGARNTTGCHNNFFGCNAGANITTGRNNVAIGRSAGASGTGTGIDNIFIGMDSGYSNNAGSSNIFLGYRTGRNNQAGNHNIFIGSLAGRTNNIGCYNTFIGRCAGYSSSGGFNNTIIGNQANVAATNLCGVIAIGTGAIATQTNQIVLSTGQIVMRSLSAFGILSGTIPENNVFIGGPNTITGNDAATGGGNFAFGSCVLGQVTTGSNNAVFGSRAGSLITTGSDNNLFGYAAGRCLGTGGNNNFFGAFTAFSCVPGSGNNFFGRRAGQYNSGGASNLFGCQAGNSAGATSSHNNMFGYRAGAQSRAGSLPTTGSFANCNNNFFGNRSGYRIQTGSDNIFIGRYSGCNTTTGACNIFIGTQATGTGLLSASISNSIVIGFSATATDSSQLVFGSPLTAPLSGLIYGNLSVTRDLSSNGNAFVTGTGTFNHVQANTKSFFIDHPTLPGKKLQYGSLESPYHGVRLTGQDVLHKGECTVQLPGYISALIREEGINIQLTNIKHDKILYVDGVDLKNNTFTVKTGVGFFDNKKYGFYWSFTAIRKDIPPLQVEV